MHQRRFVPATLLETYALYQIPYGTNLIISCQSCRVDRDVAREYLQQVSNLMQSLKELTPRFRCTLCEKENARIMAGAWSAGTQG